MKMLWFYLNVLTSAITFGLSINRPAYKVILMQNGYAEYLQYDIQTPPIEEFTFCTWFRTYDLADDQTIFTYITQENKHVIRLWLDSDGKHMKVLINNKVSSSSRVDIIKDIWWHVCLSYQSDYGAWALYIDSRLLSCHSSESVTGFIMPGSGSIVIGYGTASDGIQTGFKGEIFGVNMILTSTIARNLPKKSINPKPSHKKRIKGVEHRLNYVVLNDLQSDEFNNNFETTNLPSTTTPKKSFIKVKTPHSFIQHEVGLNLKMNQADAAFTQNNLAVITTEKATANNNHINLSADGPNGNKHVNDLRQSPISQELPVLYEHEMPPPISESIYKVHDDTSDTIFQNKQSYPISEVVLPPPLNKDTEVYSKLSSSTFAGSVLNYLKNQQLHSKERKRIVTPPTIPLVKISDNLPYASDFKVIKVPPPYQHRNFVEELILENKNLPQINVKVLDDLRNNILKSHAQNKAQSVEINNAGLPRHHQAHDLHRNVAEHQYSKKSSQNLFHAKKLHPSKTSKINIAADIQLSNQTLLIPIVPLLKSLEHLTKESLHTIAENLENGNDMYTRSLSVGNKWHHVKLNNNDYTPRQINAGLGNDEMSLDEKTIEVNKRHTAVGFKHKNYISKVVKDDDFIPLGKELGKEVFNSSNYNSNLVFLNKYNRGFLTTNSNNVADKIRNNYYSTELSFISDENIENDFDKQVKLGNALNERPVIGTNVDQTKKSFVGGDESVPDINKYRSNIDDDEIFTSVPGSLDKRFCKNLELYGRVLHVNSDDSIDISRKLFVIKMKNVGIEFIIQSYKKCSLEDTPIKDNAMVIIDWNKTPVRLFDGAYTRRTTDLCGYF